MLKRYTLPMIAGILCALPGFSQSKENKQGSFDNRRVIVFGIDGMRRDALKQLMDEHKVPNMSTLAKEGTTFWNMEAGGNLDNETKQPTISGPGWATICTGVFANKHGVVDNSFKDAHFDRYPHFFKFLRESKPSAILASICSWDPVNTKVLQSSGEKLANTCLCSNGDPEDPKTCATTIKTVTETNPDAVFVHFDNVDHMGHTAGFGPNIKEYMDSIIEVDDHIGQIIRAIESRPNYKQEQWLFIVTSDHGGIRKGHGGQSREEREIASIVKGTNIPADKKNTEKCYQDILVPIILQYLGIPIKTEWNLEINSVKF